MGVASPRSQGVFRRRAGAGIRWLCFALSLLGAMGGPVRGESQDAVKGLPFTRFYSFDEIGDVLRGARLTFDRHGRIAAVQDGAMFVLNDNVWLDLAPKGSSTIRIQQVTCDRDGTSYFGGLGSCGRLRLRDDGRLIPESFVPTTAPSWVPVTSFNDILLRPEGVYFGGFNGVLFWNRSTNRTTLIEVPGLAALFAVDDRVFASVNGMGARPLDIAAGKVLDSEATVFGASVIDHAAALGDGRTLMSTTGRSLFLYAGGKLTPFDQILGGRLGGRVAALQPLPEGGVAVAITGHGLFIVSPTGEITLALTSPDYHRVTSLAAHEPGVLWAATEAGVLKIVHGAPLTWFGQELGLPVQWPQIVAWQNSIVIASNGRLYEPLSVSADGPTHFRLAPDQPAAGTWGIAAKNEWLLLGNAEGLFVRRAGEPLRKLDVAVDGARLAMVGDVCLVVSAREIAAFRCEGNTWRECAARVPGLGYPALIHGGQSAAWIEIGANRAARVSYRDGAIRTRLFDSFPWPESRWINVSLLDDLVILSAPGQGRLFFDDRTEQFIAHPPIDEVLDHAPFSASRVWRGARGVLWLSHDHGVTTLLPQEQGYRPDTTTYRILTDHTPLVLAPADGTLWISSGNSLYRVMRSSAVPASDPFHVSLVSVRDLDGNRELLTERVRPFREPIPYHQKNLALRFFAGSYALKRAPVYEFRLNENDWNSLEATSLVRLSELREGSYRLDVRLVDHGSPIGTPMSLQFTVAPPWYRTWRAYLAYAALTIGTVVGVVRLALHRARARNAVLEAAVAQRTEELKATMRKLQQETQIAATLAERNRLAGEIHDSLEQGFSGLMLHLETTAGLAPCPPEVRNGLAMARSMVAFSRNEVRHAVWDLHSPLLESGGLETALKNIVAHLAPEPGRSSLIVEGKISAVGSTIEHHLLRIGQEAIANAVKHADAAHLEIRLVFTDRDVRLTVRDDGKGFDPRTVFSHSGEHFGLRSLRTRASKIGARLEIDSQPGFGTTVSVTAPLVVPCV